MSTCLLFFEKMQAIRERNALELEVIKHSRKNSSIEKQIKNVQKMYTARIENVKSQAERYRKWATVEFQNQAHIGTTSFNPLNYGGMTEFAMNCMGQLVQQGMKLGSGTEVTQMSAEQFSEMMDYYNMNGGFGRQGIKDDKNIPDPNYYYDANNQKTYSTKDVQLFLAARSEAARQQQFVQNQVQQATMNYQDNVSIWETAMIAELEAEQDDVLEPLSFEQTMQELDSEATKTELDTVKERIKNLDEEIKERVQGDSMKFGL
ncbi:MAG: hypothetical protein MJ237_04365 [bacterium]|nr:hypothetical protein [bacterium]